MAVVVVAEIPCAFHSPHLAPPSVPLPLALITAGAVLQSGSDSRRGSINFGKCKELSLLNIVYSQIK